VSRYARTGHGVSQKTRLILVDDALADFGTPARAHTAGVGHCGQRSSSDIEATQTSGHIHLAQFKVCASHPFGHQMGLDSPQPVEVSSRYSPLYRDHLRLLEKSNWTGRALVTSRADYPRADVLGGLEHP